MKVIKFNDMTHYYLTKEDGWVKVTEELNKYSVSSIGRTPVKLAILPEGAEPNDTTKSNCILGGLIDQYTSDKNIHFWCRTSEPHAVVSVRLAGLGENDEFTRIRASIMGLDAQVIKLTRRATSLELDNDVNKRSIQAIDKSTANMQAIVGEMIAEIADLEVEQALFRIGIKDVVRTTIDKFKMKMLDDFNQKFRYYSTNLETTDYLVRTTMTAITTFLKLTDPKDINKAYKEFLIGHPTASKEMNDLLMVMKDFAIYLADIKSLTGTQQINANRKIAIYMDATNKFSSADTIGKLEAIYQEIISHPNFLPDMLETVTNLKQVYFYLLTSKITTDRITEDMNTLRNEIHSPIFGTTTDLADLEQMINSAYP